MSKVSSKRQVTIPVRVLDEAGLVTGDELVIRALAPGRIELERADDLIERYAGCLSADTYPPGYLDRVRDEWRQ
jgi:bifunctional DNA-binding transcriptional regulator/antitoxin component of YhaV-PrlF toxin-antitoxin module